MLGKPEMHLEVHKVSVISNSIKYPTQKPLCSTDRQLNSRLMILLTSDLFIPADLDVVDVDDFIVPSFMLEITHSNGKLYLH